MHLRLARTRTSFPRPRLPIGFWFVYYQCLSDSNDACLGNGHPSACPANASLRFGRYQSTENLVNRTTSIVMSLFKASSLTPKENMKKLSWRWRYQTFCQAKKICSIELKAKRLCRTVCRQCQVVVNKLHPSFLCLTKTNAEITSLDFELTSNPIMPTTTGIQQDALAYALSEIIWKAGNGQTATICLPHPNAVHVTTSPQFNEDGLTEKVNLLDEEYR